MEGGRKSTTETEELIGQTDDATGMDSMLLWFSFGELISNIKVQSIMILPKDLLNYSFSKYTDHLE